MTTMTNKKSWWHICTFGRKPEPDAPTPEPNVPPFDYPPGYRPRQLIDGSWVIWREEEGGALDLTQPSMLWRPGQRCFKYCVASSRQELDSKAIPALAMAGVFMPEPKATAPTHAD